MTPEDLLKLAGERVGPTSFRVCELCDGPYDSHAVPALLRQSDEESGVVARMYLEKALLIRFAGLCLQCSNRVIEAGKAVSFTAGAK